MILLIVWWRRPGGPARVGGIRKGGLGIDPTLSAREERATSDPCSHSTGSLR